MALYNDFYGFRASPFQLNPDPRFWFSGVAHREALAGLWYAVIERKGFAVLSGEVGTGKTTIVHALLEHLGAQACFALVVNPKMTRDELYAHLLAEFELPAEPTFMSSSFALQKFLASQFEVPVVLIIDEAHALSDELLEEVRLLSNFETSRNKLIQVLLVGQPELMERLQRPELRQLRQRMALRFELSGLSFRETIRYVDTRISVAGGPAFLFSLPALEALYRYSGGYPRLINIICDNALLLGYNRDHRTIDRSLVRLVARDLKLPAIARLGLWERLSVRYGNLQPAASSELGIPAGVTMGTER